MAGASNAVELQSTSKVQVHMVDVLSKDLTNSNCSHGEPFQEDGIPSAQTILEPSSFATASQRSNCEVTNFIETLRRDLMHITVLMNDLHIKENTSEENCEKINGISEENPIVSSVKISNSVLLPEEKEIIQPSVSEETKSTEVIHPAISEETHLNYAIQSSLDSSSEKGPVPSSDTKVQISPHNAINSSAVREISSERFSGNSIHLSNSEKHLDSSGVEAIDTDNFALLQESEEFKNGTRSIVRGYLCGAHVIARPSSPLPPIDPDLEKYLESIIASDATMNSPSPSVVPKYLSSKTSLCTWLSILIDWVNTGLDKVFNRPETSYMADLLDYAEKELAYGLNVLKHMDKRVTTLLTAAITLPDPHSNLLCGLSGQRNLFRDGLKDAGTKVWRRLEALKAELTKNHERFITVRCQGSELDNDEFDVNQLEAMALNIISNSYVKVLEDYSTLKLEIENFGNKIRDFCSDLDNFV